MDKLFLSTLALFIFFRWKRRKVQQLGSLADKLKDPDIKNLLDIETHIHSDIKKLKKIIM